MQTSRIRPSVLGGLLAAFMMGAGMVSSAQAGTPSASSGGGPAGTSIYGIPLFKPFTAMPECPTKAIGEYQSYEIDVPHPCFEHLDQSRLGRAAAGTESLFIEYPMGTFPEMYNGMYVSLINGVVHSIDLITHGVEAQAHDFALLQGEFGKPLSQRTVTVQNRMGASFEVIEATWQLPDGVSVSFRGTGESLDAGKVTATTPQERARQQAELDQQREGVPRL